MRDHEDDPNFEDGMLKDGHTFRVPHRMLDGVSRSVRDHYAHQPQDRTGPLRVSDQFGSPLGLHRPGYRLGDALVRDGQQAEMSAPMRPMTRACRGHICSIKMRTGTSWRVARPNCTPRSLALAAVPTTSRNICQASTMMS